MYGDFEMEETPAHSHPQVSCGPASLYSTVGQSRDPQGFTMHARRTFDDALAVTGASQQKQLEPSVLHLYDSLAPSDARLARDSVSCRQNTFLRTQDDRSLNNVPEGQQPQSQSLPRKRTPKVPTISAKKWIPCESRMKEVYVHDRKSIEELREIINKEFGLTANLRQYKAQIQHMKLERNVKSNERIAVTRYIHYRINLAGKKTSYVRVRGHKIDPEKLSRWMKESDIDQPCMPTCPSSPLPSSISIYTNSPCTSPRPMQSSLVEYQVPDIASMSPGNEKSDIIQRILKYAYLPKEILEYQESRFILNDLQHILSSNDTPGKSHHDTWNLPLEGDILRVRNLMNMAHRLTVSREWEETPRPIVAGANRNLRSNPPRVSSRYASWSTHYGRVDALFWTTSINTGVIDEDTRENLDENFAAKVTIVPNSCRIRSLRVIFDFRPILDPIPKITYQAMIPNDSEVFQIIASGQVEKLIEALDVGSISLTDRDEEGRSLLNYAFWHSHGDMCRFLLDKNADVNGMEMNLHGYFGPIHEGEAGLDSENDEEGRRRKAYCMKIMLEAGADVSLAPASEGYWMNTFMCAVVSGSVEMLKHMLDLGQPFISPNSFYLDGTGTERAPLIELADFCGLYYGDAIHIIDKAILLLNRNVDISCRDSNGDTVLHKVLRSERLHEQEPYAEAVKRGRQLRWTLSLKEPQELLMVFITAGADVYATNDEGETLSIVAFTYGRDEEWIEALELCGFDAQQVLTDSCRCHANRPLERQKSKLSFEDYCQQWQKRPRLEEVDIDDEDDDDEDDDDEDDDDEDHGADEDDDVECMTAGPEVFNESTEYGNGNSDNLREGGCNAYGMHVDLEDTGGNYRIGYVAETDSQSVEPDDGECNGITGMNLDFGHLVNDEKDITEEFFDFDTYEDASL